MRSRGGPRRFPRGGEPRTTFEKVDDIIADAADPDYTQPNQLRLRDLTTVRQLIELLREV